MKKINIFPLTVQRGLVQVAFYNVPAAYGFSPFYEIFRDFGVKLKFFAHLGRDNNTFELSFCLAEDEFEDARASLEGLGKASGGVKIAVKRGVATIRILGPHFDIRTRVSGLIYDALVGEGVEILGNSTTITTCLLVVAEDSVEDALRGLRRFFRDKQKR